MNSIFDQNECVFSNQALLKIDELKMALNCSCIFNLKMLLQCMFTFFCICMSMQIIWQSISTYMYRCPKVPTHFSQKKNNEFVW